MSLISRNRDPSRRQLIIFGAAWLGFFGLLGLKLWLRRRPGPAELLWAFAAAAPLAGLVRLKFLRWIYLGASAVTHPIGLVVSHVVLAVVYYVALTPIGLVMRLFRYDPLARRFDRGAGSYWIDRAPAKSAESYFRQD
jgi:hypothetical protein